MGWTQHQILPDMSNSQRIPISSRRLIQAHHTHTILTILHYCTYIRILLAGYHWTFQSKHQLMELSLVLRFGLGRIIHLEKYSATMIWGQVFSPEIRCLCKPGKSQYFGLSGFQNWQKRGKKHFFWACGGCMGGVWEAYGKPKFRKKEKIWEHWAQ